MDHSRQARYISDSTQTDLLPALIPNFRNPTSIMLSQELYDSQVVANLKVEYVIYFYIKYDLSRTTSQQLIVVLHNILYDQLSGQLG